MTLREIVNKELIYEEENKKKKETVKKTEDKRENAESAQKSDINKIKEVFGSKYEKLLSNNINIEFLADVIKKETHKNKETNEKREYQYHQYYYVIKIDNEEVARAFVKGNYVQIIGTQETGGQTKFLLNNFKEVKDFRDKNCIDTLEKACQALKIIPKIKNALKDEYKDAKINYEYINNNTEKNRYYFSIELNGKKFTNRSEYLTNSETVNKFIKKMLDGDLSTKELEEFQVAEINDAAVGGSNNEYLEGKATIFTLREGTITAKNNKIIYNPNGTIKDKTGSNGADQMILYKNKIILVELKNWSDIRYDRTLVPIEKLLEELNNTKNNYSIGVIETRDLTSKNKEERSSVIGQFNKLIKRTDTETIINNNKSFNNYHSKELISNKIEDYAIFRVSTTEEFIEQVIKPIRKQVGFYADILNSKNDPKIKQIVKNNSERINTNTNASISTNQTNTEKNINICKEAVTSLSKCCDEMKKIGMKSSLLDNEILQLKNIETALNKLSSVNNKKNIITGNWDEINKSQEKNTKNDYEEYEEYANAASVQTKYFNY